MEQKAHGGFNIHRFTSPSILTHVALAGSVQNVDLHIRAIPGHQKYCMEPNEKKATTKK